MEKLQFLQSIFGQGRKANQDFYQFNCPFHIGQHGPKFGINLKTGLAKCWVCGPKGNVVDVIKKLRLGDDKVRIAKEYFRPLDKSWAVKKNDQPEISLPKEFQPLFNPGKGFFYERAKDYVLGRGITEKDILKHRLGYCIDGKYKGMIIAPSYDDIGRLNFFIGRSFENQSNFRFKNPDIDKNLIFDEFLVNWQEPIILVESKFDSIVVKRNCLPLYGKQISQRLKTKILEEGTEKVYICLDGDAVREIIKESDFFVRNGIEVFIVKLPENEDPCSLGHERVWEFIQQAKPVNEDMIFEFKILEKLKR